jgi:hypothetical protein
MSTYSSFGLNCISTTDTLNENIYVFLCTSQAQLTKYLLELKAF